MDNRTYKAPIGLTLKDYIRIEFLPFLAKLLNRLGLPWNKIGRSKIGPSTLLAQSAAIKRTMVVEETIKPLKIFFLTMLGGHVHNITVDIVLAFGLKAKGHKITFIINDQTLPITEEVKNGEEKKWTKTLARSYAFGKKYIQQAGFKLITVSQAINENIDIDINEFDDIIEASLLKHYKIGVITPKIKNLDQKKNLVVASTKMSAKTGHFILKNTPDRVIMSHGIYSSWGPAFRILNKHNIPIVTYSKTKKKKSEKFSWNKTADNWDVSSEWNRVKDIPLTTEQLKSIDDYLESRVTHKDDILTYNFGKLESTNKTLQRFGLDNDKPIYSLFTNVLWDAASTQREIVFENPVNWVVETIEWFRKNPEKQLIVKIHPAEVVIGTNQPFAELLNNLIPEIPPNVKIILPEEKVNSWSIYKVTDLGIVHTTTVGMELPLLGIPTLVVSETHYRDKGFTLDVNSKAEYYSILSSFNRKDYDIERMKSQAKKYAYLLFERFQLPFEMFDEPSWTDVRSFSFNSIEEMYEKPHFKEIINCIINKKDFFID